MKLIEVDNTVFTVYEYEPLTNPPIIPVDEFSPRVPARVTSRAIYLQPGIIDGRIEFRFYDEKTDTLYFKRS